MSFHDVRFPTNISFGSSGGPERRTEIIALKNGFEERNSPWTHSRRHYDAGIGMRSLDDLAKVVAFFEARFGQLYGFRWKDWTDFKSCKPSEAVSDADQVLSTGDGAQTVFQLLKTYESGGETYARPISKPVLGSVVIAMDAVALVDGVDFVIDVATGLITFAVAPPALATLTCGYNMMCRCGLTPIISRRMSPLLPPEASRRLPSLRCVSNAGY